MFRRFRSLSISHRLVTVADLSSSDPQQDQEAPPPQRPATAGAPFASRSQLRRPTDRPAGNPGEAKAHQSRAAKAGPQKRGPGGQKPDQPHSARPRKPDENIQKQYNTLSQRVTPNKSLPVALPLKSLTVSGLIVVHTVWNLVASFLTVSYASTCTCKLQRWTRMHPSAKLVP